MQTSKTALNTLLKRLQKSSQNQPQNVPQKPRKNYLKQIRITKICTKFQIFVHTILWFWEPTVSKQIRTKLTTSSISATSCLSYAPCVGTDSPGPGEAAFLLSGQTQLKSNKFGKNKTVSAIFILLLLLSFVFSFVFSYASSVEYLCLLIVSCFHCGPPYLR